MFKLLKKNPAPKHCGQHMRHQSQMPKSLQGVQGDCWKCMKCGTFTINSTGNGSTIGRTMRPLLDLDRDTPLPPALTPPPPGDPRWVKLFDE